MKYAHVVRQHRHINNNTYVQAGKLTHTSFCAPTADMLMLLHAAQRVCKLARICYDTLAVPRGYLNSLVACCCDKAFALSHRSQSDGRSPDPCHSSTTTTTTTTNNHNNDNNHHDTNNIIIMQPLASRFRLLNMELPPIRDFFPCYE